MKIIQVNDVVTLDNDIDYLVKENDIEVTFSGISISVRLVQSYKIHLPIIVSSSGRSISVIFVQP